MHRIDDGFLIEVGLESLSRTGRAEFLSHVIETLQMRVGEAIVQTLSSEQLDEFVALTEAKLPESVALQWLEKNAPKYRESVDAELVRLKAEIRSVAGVILEDDSAERS